MTKNKRIKVGRIDDWDVCLRSGPSGLAIEYGPMLFARSTIYGEPHKLGWQIQGPYRASEILAIFALLAPHTAVLEANASEPWVGFIRAKLDGVQVWGVLDSQGDVVIGDARFYSLARFTEVEHVPLDEVPPDPARRLAPAYTAAMASS